MNKCFIIYIFRTIDLIFVAKVYRNVSAVVRSGFWL